MNKIYSKVWNVALGQLVVASEYAAFHGGSGASRVTRRGIKMCAMTMMAAAVALAMPAHAQQVDANNQKVVNVADGDVSVGSTDAVNGSQLFVTNQNVATNAGDIAANLGYITALQDVALQWSNALGAYDASHAGAAQNIVNLAAGDLSAASTEAVNGSQLFATNQDVAANATGIGNNATTIGGNTADIHTNTTNIGNNATDIGNNAMDIAALQSSVGQPITFSGNDDAGGPVSAPLGSTVNIKGAASTGGTYSAGNIKTVTDVGTGSLTIQMADSPQFGGVVVNQGGSGVISGVAAGVDADDAVNVDQLDAMGGKVDQLGGDVAGILGGGATYDPVTGGLGDPTYTITTANGTTQVHDVGEALDKMNGVGGVASGIKYFHANSTESDSQAIGINSVAIGPTTVAAGEAGYAAGHAADIDVTSDSAVAIGDGATVGHDSSNTVAIGTNAKSSPDTVTATVNDSVAIGHDTQVHGDDAVAMGHASNADAGAVGIGLNAAATANAVAMGRDAVAAGGNTVATGHGAQANMSEDIAIGLNAGSGSTSTTNTTSDIQNVYIGSSAGANVLNGGHNVAVGYQAGMSRGDNSDQNVAMGAQAGMGQSGRFNVAIGNQASSSALSQAATGTTAESVAIGRQAGAEANGAISIGSLTRALGTNATTLGYDAYSRAADSLALGSHADAVAAGSIALGANSLADTSFDDPATGAFLTSETATHILSIGAPVGSPNSSAGMTRRIVNVAGGAAGTDAVNVNQLKELESNIQTVIGSSDLTINPDGSMSYNHDGGSSIQQVLNNLAVGGGGGGSTAYPVGYDGAGYASVTLAGAGGTTISNVAAGTGQHDAVNVQQLNETVDAAKVHYFSVRPISGADNENNGKATGDDSLAVGQANLAAGNNSVAIGRGTVAGDEKGDEGAITVGHDAVVNVAYGTALGVGANAKVGDHATAIGHAARADGVSSVALGHNAQVEVTANSSADDGAAIGTDAYVNADQGQAFGHEASARDGAVRGVAIGDNAESVGAPDAYAIGTRALANAASAHATGTDSLADAGNAYAQGTSAEAHAQDSQAYGTGAVTGQYATNSVAFGTGAETGIGNPAIASTDSIAMGTDARVAGNHSIAIGAGNVVGQQSGTGATATLAGNRSAALGNDNVISQDNTFVVGNDVTTTQANSVVLGNASADRAATTETGATIDHKSYTYAGQGKAEYGVVSVGHPGAERQVINMAAGKVSSDSTDAVNGSQLYVTDQAVDALGDDLDTAGQSVADTLGGSSSYDAGTHQVTAGLSVNGNNYSNVQDALDYLGQGWNLTAEGASGSNVGPDDAVDLSNTDGNIEVAKTGTSNDVTFDLADDIDVASVTAGDSTLDTSGLTVDDGSGNVTTTGAAGTTVTDASGNSTTVASTGTTITDGAGTTVTTTPTGTTITDGTNTTGYGADGLTITNGPVISSAGIDAGSKKITNVADGTDPSDAVNLSQLQAQETHYYSVNDGGTQGDNYDNDGATGTDALAAGVGASATATNAVAIGYNAAAQDVSAVSIGGGNTANGAGAVTVGGGTPNIATGTGILAMGNGNTAGNTAGATLNPDGTTGSVALGSGNTAGDNFISIGPIQKFNSPGNGAVAIGQDNTAKGPGAIAMGSGSSATSQEVFGSTKFFGAIAMGYQSVASDGAIAMGSSANAAQGTVAIGTDTKGVANAVAIGTNAQGNTETVAIGLNAQADIVSIPTGPSTSQGTGSSIAIGHGATANMSDVTDIGGMIALGNNAVVTRSAGIALGSVANVSAPQGLAVGLRAAVSGDNGTAVGVDSAASGANSIAMGNGAQAQGADSISVGTGNVVSGANSGAFGDPNTVSGAGSYALGNNNTVTANDAFVLGSNVNDAVDNSVALGAGTTVAVANTTYYNPGTATLAGTATGVVSVGASGAERQIQNVAPGASPTDAVNVSQLQSVAAVADNAVQYDDTGKGSVTLGGTPSTDGGVTGGTTITNVHQGDVSATSTDAVNGSQLYSVQQTAGSALQTINTTVDGTAVKTLTKTDNTQDFESGKNIALSNDNGSIEVSTKDNVDFTSVTTGNTVMNNAGVTVDDGSGNVTTTEATGTTVTDASGNTTTVASTGTTIADSAGSSVTTTPTGTTMTDGTNTTNYGADGLAITNGPVISSAGIDAGNAQITNVASGMTDAGGNPVTSIDDAVDSNAATMGDLQQAADSVKTHYYSVNDGGTQQGNYNNDGATGTNALAAGVDALAGGTGSVAVGAHASASDFSGVSIGSDSEAQGERAVAVGYQAGQGATGDFNVAVGSSAGKDVQGNSNSSFGLSAGNDTAGRQNTALGSFSGQHVEGDGNLAAGNASGFTVLGDYNVAMGHKAGRLVTGDNNAAMGTLAGGSVNGNGNLALGASAGDAVTGDQNVATGIRAGSNVAGTLNIAQGGLAGNNVTGNANIATGAFAGQHVEGDRNVAIGYQAGMFDSDTELNNAVSIGSQALASADDAVAIGHGAEASGVSSIAIGTGNVVSGANSGAFGDPNTISGTGSYAFGNNNSIANDNTFVMGNGVTTTQNNSVVLGNGSTDGAVHTGTTATQVTLGGTTYTYAGPASSAAGMVSVGAAGAERQIQNVAAGDITATSTDAVNGSQLYATNQAVDAVSAVANAGWNVGVNGGTAAQVKPGDNVDFSNTDNNLEIARADSGTDHDITVDLADDIDVASVTAGSSTLDTSGLTVDDGTNSTSYGAGGMSIAGGPQITVVGIDAGNKKITNVAAGTADSDAVNKGQLDDAVTGATTAGMNFTGNDGGTVHRDLGQTLAITGEATTTGTFGGGNIKTVTDPATGAVQIQIADSPKFGDITINVDGSGRITGVAKGINGTDAVNKDQLDAVSQVANAGWNVSAQGANASNVKPGDSVDLNNSDGNIVVSKTGASNDVTFDLADDIEVDSVSLGSDIRLDTTGLIIVGGPSVTVNGIDAGGLKITNVAPGTDPTDAVNVSQLDAVSDSVDQLADNAVQYDDGSKDQVTLGGTTSTDGGKTGGTTITNVHRGDVSADSTDAVNGSQLYETNQNVADNSKTIENIQNGNAGYFQVNDTSGKGKPKATGKDATAGGAGAVASAKDSTALGSGAEAKAGNSVALGAGSVADRADSVSVGVEGGERQVTHVAAGTQGTDAVNVNQLHDSMGQVTNWAKNYTDKRFNALGRDLNQVSRRANAGVAAAMAMSSLPQAYQPNQSAAAVALGSFHGESAMAIGVSTITDSGRYVFKLNATGNTEGDVGVGVGAAIVW